MFKKIILSVVTSVIVMSGVSIVSADNNNCGDVWNRFNARETVTRSEFTVCKKKIIQFYRNEIRLEYREYKENKSYCSDKWVEINYRRNATFVENRLCGKKFKKYQKQEMSYRTQVLKDRGVAYRK